MKTIPKEIEATFKTLESFDIDTAMHAKRTANFVGLLYDQMKTDPAFAKELQNTNKDTFMLCATLHDIGKTRINKKILNKTSGLTDSEFKKMRNHTLQGEKIIKNIKKDFGKDTYKIANDMAKFHHEKWNGSGYPDKLKENEIPLSARMLAIADVYDALTSKRSYKEPYPHEVVCKIINDEKGIHFDPIIAKVFLNSNQKFKSMLQGELTTTQSPLQNTTSNQKEVTIDER